MVRGGVVPTSRGAFHSTPIPLRPVKGEAIEGQAQPHRKMAFKEEVEAFLKKHGMGYHYSDIYHLRPRRRSIRVDPVIEWRWVGTKRAAGNSWPKDYGRGRAGCAAASG